MRDFLLMKNLPTAFQRNALWTAVTALSITVIGALAIRRHRLVDLGVPRHVAPGLRAAGEGRRASQRGHRRRRCRRRHAHPRPLASPPCHIREKAADKVYSELGRLKAMREDKLARGEGAEEGGGPAGADADVVKV